MKFVAIGDTHGFHREVILPEGDVLLHAGDITDYGTKEEVIDFVEWMASLNFTHKIFIGGNHDIYLDEYPVDLLEILSPELIYLNNRGVTLDGIKIWGSPVSPDFPNMAFGKTRGLEMEQHWHYMPLEIDILLTHTPPFGILDKSSERLKLGCSVLLEKVKAIKPAFHVFGHIHASYGQLKTPETTFINASILDSLLGPVNLPIAFEWSKSA